MIYNLENSDLMIKISTLGAELQSIFDKKTGVEYLWQGNPEFWGRRAPLLFPIVGRLKNDQYYYREQLYHMNQHGFARDSEFKMVTHSEDFISFELSANEETLKKYPFQFKLMVHYRLQQKQLLVWIDVINESNQEEMIYGIGAHPAFSTQLNGDNFENYTIRYQSLSPFYRYMMEPPLLNTEIVEIVNNPKIELERQWFEHDAVIYGIDQTNTVITVHNQHHHGVQMSFKDVPFIGVWSPYPKDAQFICIEPWQGIADTVDSDSNLETKFGMNRLEPLATKSFSYTLEFF